MVARARRCGNCRRRLPSGFERACPSCGSGQPDEARSRIMRAIKGSGTKPERLLERALRRAGARFKRQDRIRPGRPDIVFPSARLAVFVDGEFFHGKLPLPRTNAEFWARKIARNVRRDAAVNRALSRMGWRRLRLGAIPVTKDPDAAARKVLKLLA